MTCPTTPSPTVAVVCTGVRPEEKMLVRAFRERGVDPVVVDDRRVYGSLAEWPVGILAGATVLLRSKSQYRNSMLAHWLEALGGVPVNGSRVIDICGDKARTSLALAGVSVPMVDAGVAFSVEGGLELGESLGFPLVVKPVVGSWGRLVGRVSDGHGLEAVLEHKEAVGGAPHAVTYVQPFVESGGADIRTFVVDGRCVAAIQRTSDHWRTNTALGARATGRQVDAELDRISVSAAAAVGGGVVAVDLFETPSGYRVNEVNGTMEFRNSVDTTGVDIPGHVADYVLRVAGRAESARVA